MKRDGLRVADEAKARDGEQSDAEHEHVTPPEPIRYRARRVCEQTVGGVVRGVEQHRDRGSLGLGSSTVVEQVGGAKVRSVAEKFPRP